jgi:uncharacterized phage protein gp47/JayE
MAEPKIIITPSGVGELKAQFARDYRLAAIDAGVVDDVSTGPGSDADLLGTACANLAIIGVINQSSAESATNVFTATGADLDRIRLDEGLPEVLPTGASGKVRVSVGGATTIAAGSQLIYPNGVRAVVVGSYFNPSDNAEINVQASDTGERTNLAAGEVMRFVAAPINVGSAATVASGSPMVGGTDAESDARKRDRILNKRRNLPAAGNWAHIRQMILDRFGAVQDCYIYPALGGPSSVKVVPVRDFEPDIGDYSRACSSTLLRQIRQYIWSQLPSGDQVVVNAAADQTANFTVRLTLPSSALSGGNGLGWTDAAPWPSLVGGDSNVVTISAVASARQVTVSALTTTSPVAGQTNVAWYSTADAKFYPALVTGVTGSSGAWVLTLDRPLLDSNGDMPAAGDYISPNALNLNGYASFWIEQFRGLGPGQNTSELDRLPRALRHPYVTDEDPSDVTTILLAQLAVAYPEISAIAFGVSATTTPTVPSDADDPPNILVPGKLGFYAT